MNNVRSPCGKTMLPLRFTAYQSLRSKLYLNMNSRIIMGALPRRTAFNPSRIIDKPADGVGMARRLKSNVSLSLNRFTRILERHGENVRQYCQKAENVPQKALMEKVKDFWNGPNFKYWFIGVSAFSTWLGYYSLNAYKSTRINITLPPAEPNHVTVERMTEIDAIFNSLRDSTKLGGKIKCVALCGPTGSGKSLLSNTAAKKLIQDVDWNPIGLPKSHVSVFLNGDSIKSFLLSLQAFAAHLKIRPSEIKEKLKTLPEKGSKTVQSKIILELVKEKLEKHPNWVFVIDNLQQGSSDEIINILNEVVLNEESATTWSKGTLLMTSDGCNLSNIAGITQVKMEPRLTEKDAVALLKDLTNIKDESFGTSHPMKVLLSRISYHPMATVCAGILMRERLQKKELSSIDGVMRDLTNEITKNSIQVMKSSILSTKDGIAESLIVAETVIAMAMKLLINDSPHLSSTVDMMAACAPRTPVPSVYIRRYLRHPSLKLPPLSIADSPQGNLQQMFKGKSTTDNMDETLDPKGKAWSNKSITEYVTKVEDWFTEIWQALKEVYNMYYGQISLDPVDTSIKFMQDCELILSWKMQPGDMESYAMHPLIYAVARQHFISKTVPELEAKFMEEDEVRFEKQPWFKKMSNYDPKSSLIRYRNNQAKVDSIPPQAPSFVEFYNNALINVSKIFEDQGLKFDESNFRFLNAEDKLKYLQGHLDRIVHSLSEQVRVSKQTVSGKMVMKYLDIHGEYIQRNHPMETTGLRSRITGMLMSAKFASNVENDVDTAILNIQEALKLQKEHYGDESTEIASILSQLAALYNSKEDSENAKQNLEEAIEIYEAQRRKDGEYKRPLELGKALGSLGVIYGTLGDRVKSKELIERGLMLQQTGAPDLSDEAQSKHFGGEFASALTDLGHAYVSLGMPLYGKKILNLSLMAHKNIHGEKHPEVVRTMTVLSIAHLMEGHNEESRKLRKEAGKVQSQINALPFY